MGPHGNNRKYWIRSPTFIRRGIILCPLLCLPILFLYSDVVLLSLVTRTTITTPPLHQTARDVDIVLQTQDDAPQLHNKKAFDQALQLRQNQDQDLSKHLQDDGVLLVQQQQQRQQQETCHYRSEDVTSTTTTTTDPDTSSIIEENHRRRHGNRNIPRNLRIVFVGDSITRYIYLSLVYYLTYGCWVSDGDPFLEMKAASSNNNNNNNNKNTNNNHNNNKYATMSWNDYLNYTNRVLYPNEECDCYRNWNKTFNWYKHVENRYYSDPIHGNYITYISKFGSYNVHGHWNATSIFYNNDNNKSNHDNDYYHHHHRIIRSFQRVPFTWHYNTWDGFVRNYISKLQFKPNYFVFNAGHWKEHELRSTTVLDALYQALQDHGIHGIYRTTTFRKDEDNYNDYKDQPTRKHDNKVCKVFEQQQQQHNGRKKRRRGCHNVSWTADLDGTEDNYLDAIHFRSHVYTRMNLELLDLLLAEEEE